MKEMKHTPGPWFENGVTVMTGPTDSDPCGYSLAHVLNPYKWVVGARDRVEANARLMAASPEMLEALQSLVNQFLQRGVFTDPEHPDRIALALAESAIAKATGGAA